MRRAGFTLIEALIALSLSVLLIAAALAAAAHAHAVFARLKDREEASLDALAALDRMRIDLLHAGRGLALESALGIIETVRLTDEEMRTVCQERPLTLAAEARAGDSKLSLESTSGIAAGQAVAVIEGDAGEVRTVASVDRAAVTLREPLERDYTLAGASVSLLETVVYSLDRRAGILRRRANASSAQPLLENAAEARWTLDPAARTVRVRLAVNLKGAKAYETIVFLKNSALARALS